MYLRYADAADAVPIASRLCDNLRGAGYAVRYGGYQRGAVELGKGISLGFATWRARAVETMLLDPTNRSVIHAAWGYDGAPRPLDAPDEDAGFDALVAEIERVNQLI